MNSPNNSDEDAPKGVSPGSAAEMDRAHLDATGRITTSDVQKLLGLKPVWAYTILRRLRERGVIVRGSEKARGRWVFYVRAATKTEPRATRDA